MLILNGGMALETVKGAKNIPPGCTRLTLNEALSYQKSIVRDWANDLDVLFLRNGCHIAAGMVTISAAVTFSFYKKQYRLPNSMIVYSLLVPITLVPVTIIYRVFEKKVTNNILVMQMSCPMCTYLHYCCIHTLASVVYPSISSAILLSLVAEKAQSVPMPNLQLQPKDYYRFLYSISKPGLLKFKGIFTVNALVILLIPYMQGKELQFIMNTIKQIENSNELL